MTVTSFAGTVVRESTALAYAAVRHPLTTALGAVGLVRGVTVGTVGLGVDLLHGGRRDEPVHQHPVDTEPVETQPDATEPVETQDAAQPEQTSEPTPAREPEPEPPGPDLFVPPPPDPADLPEPIVIVAEDEPGEEFHTEPKASSRASAHGGPAGDREEVEGYVEEIPDPEEQPGLSG